MDTIFLSGLTYLLMILGAWTAILVCGIVHNIVKGNHEHSCCRKADLYHLVLLLIACASAFVVVFVHPGLVYKIPSTLAVFEVGSIPILWYLTEKHFKDWVRISHSSTSS